ncbi:polysaccharide deacetylase family protein [Candidatus Gracilibacteria bacterium]|nr:polysaccharide deacetylase family protein [Candidatus Gracilibacteria bacterium]
MKKKHLSIGVIFSLLFVLVLPFAFSVNNNSTLLSALDSVISFDYPNQNVSTKIPILMYHYVRNVDKNFDPMGWRLSISPEYFEEQMKYLKENGYTTINLKDIEDGKVPEKSIVLTFDDGLEDFYTTALPVLQKYGFTASNAIITDMIGNKGHMTMEQLRACRSAGIEIISHSKSHSSMSSLSKNNLLSQILDSGDFLKNNFGVEPLSFVFPSGKYNKLVIKTLKENGYKIALTTNEGEANLSNDDMLILPRIRIDNRRAISGFQKTLEELLIKK